MSRTYTEECCRVGYEGYVNSCAESFLESLCKLYSKFCPVRTKNISVKRLTKPWLTGDLTNSINYKHRLFREYKSGFVPFIVYNNYKNQLSSLLKVAKSN